MSQPDEDGMVPAEPVVKFGQLEDARTLLKEGGPVPDGLRPAVAELARSATKRRWLALGHLVLATYWLLPVSDSHVPWRQLIGVAWLVLAAITWVEQQRTVRATRRAGLGPVTRWGWPR